IRLTPTLSATVCNVTRPTSRVCPRSPSETAVAIVGASDARVAGRRHRGQTANRLLTPCALADEIQHRAPGATLLVGQHRRIRQGAEGGQPFERTNGLVGEEHMRFHL